MPAHPFPESLVIRATSAIILLSILMTCVATGCNTSPTDTVATPNDQQASTAIEQTVIDIDDPSACAPCHETVVDEWRASQHAHAHASNDPLYAALLELRSERAGRDLSGNCATCHHPRALEDPNGAIAQQGVSCATCHAVEEVVNGTGHQALVFSSDDRLLGPHDIEGPGSPVHLNGRAADHLVDGQTLCLACHGEHANPQGVPTCTTGAEHAAEVSAEPCTSCHMPEVDGPAGTVATHDTHRSHTFIAGHGSRRTGNDEWMLGTAELRGELTNGEAIIEVANHSGHATPTGFPGRRIALTLTGRDAVGAEVWRSSDLEDPALRADLEFARYYGDDAGEPAMPPFATQLLRDTRLAAGETREIRVPVPETVATLEASLVFHFAPAPMLASNGLGEDAHFAPMTIAEVTIQPVAPGP